MTPLLLPLTATADLPAELLGGKAANLRLLHTAGLALPETLCLTTEGYRRYLAATGLRTRLRLELGRKPFDQLRWEELWDLGLRIRNLFLRTPLPTDLERELRLALPRWASETPLVVRSSGRGEDAPGRSFAGLHDSLVNVQGLPALCDAIRVVWASLWSDRALLYRRELKLDPAQSAMAVVIQPLVKGRCSGVLFSRAPGQRAVVAIEAVWGLGEALVSGGASPDRWLIPRTPPDEPVHAPPEQRLWTVPVHDGTRCRPVPPKLDHPPLARAELFELRNLALQLEELLGYPIDVEWTCQGDQALVLQVRAAGSLEQGTERAWSLSLNRSLDQLEALRQEVEQELLPALRDTAARLRQVHLTDLNDRDLACQLAACREALEHWEEVYRNTLIPMAHGIRLFGQVYNDLMKPADSFAFTHLLCGTPLAGVQRNRALQALAAALAQGADTEAEALLDSFLQQYRTLGYDRAQVRSLAQRLGERRLDEPTDGPMLEEQLFAQTPADRHPWLRRLLELGRAAWRLRDDDNLLMEQLRWPFHCAVAEIRRRLRQDFHPELVRLDLRLPQLSLSRQGGDRPAIGRPPDSGQLQLRARQLLGHPAGPGWAQGPARLLETVADLSRVEAGDILVCDALDPTLTLAVPLAAAIIERRGGMLIHGAIIAREYGLPCVTGIPAATAWIANGDWLTVDGYLGLVTIDTDRPSAPPIAAPADGE